MTKRHRLLVAEVPWCCAGLSYAHLANQQVLVSLLQDGKDRPTVRHKTRLALGERGCAETLSWPLFTASQEEKLQGICTERFVQKLNGRRRQIQELERIWWPWFRPAPPSRWSTAKPRAGSVVFKALDSSLRWDRHG